MFICLSPETSREPRHQLRQNTCLLACWRVESYCFTLLQALWFRPSKHFICPSNCWCQLAHWVEERCCRRAREAGRDVAHENFAWYESVKTWYVYLCVVDSWARLAKGVSVCRRISKKKTPLTKGVSESLRKRTSLFFTIFGISRALLCTWTNCKPGSDFCMMCCQESTNMTFSGCASL